MSSRVSNEPNAQALLRCVWSIRVLAAVAVVWLGSACGPDSRIHPPVDPCDLPGADLDSDGDGFPACIDVDDNDAFSHPDAVEICDGVDNNGDGTVDEGVRGNEPRCPAADCEETRRDSRKSGVYFIGGEFAEPFPVYCHHADDGTIWQLISTLVDDVAGALTEDRICLDPDAPECIGHIPEVQFMPDECSYRLRLETDSGSWIVLGGFEDPYVDDTPGVVEMLAGLRYIADAPYLDPPHAWNLLEHIDPDIHVVSRSPDLEGVSMDIDALAAHSGGISFWQSHDNRWVLVAAFNFVPLANGGGVDLGGIVAGEPVSWVTGEAGALYFSCFREPSPDAP